VVNVISAVGEPIEPPEVFSKFRNAIGSIIRTKMVLDPTIPDWPTVPEGRKEAMWQMLRQTFILPRGTQDRVRHYARKMLGESFRRWKSELNTKYVKTGRTPFADYGEITQAQWEEFVRQKSTEQSLALSKKNTEQATSNVHKVHLGPGGYQRKADQWRREREAAIAAGQPDPFEGLTERAMFWLQARKPKIVEGKPHFDKPKTEAVAQKIYELTELQKQGKFSIKRDKDVLSTTIGTKEHGGRIKGVSSKLTFRDGFEEDRSTYKRHDRYKEEMIQAAEKAAESKFKEMFAQLAE